MATTHAAQTPTTRVGAAEVARVRCSRGGAVTRSLLGYGVMAGPVYVGVSVAQALTRDGFDLSRHEWSLLANGPGGWVQVANFIVTGLMVTAAAIGYGRAMTTGAAARWVPRLLAVYGVALVAAGVFRADPMNGFPVGTPAGPPTSPSVHGMLHLVTAGIGFLALVAATWLLAVRFRREGRHGHAVFAAVTGAAFLVAFAAVASGSTAPALNIAFTAAIILTWIWLSVTSVHQYRNVP
jgi:hypothetical membrane protein